VCESFVGSGKISHQNSLDLVGKNAIPICFQSVEWRGCIKLEKYLFLLSSHIC